MKTEPFMVTRTLVPNVSAGLGSYDMEGESLLITSEIANDDKEYDLLTQRTQERGPYISIYVCCEFSLLSP